MQSSGFAPRRLGHANLFVSDLERSIGFWSKTAGIELVRKEPGIKGGFHSNGNTHHDVGMIQAAQGVVRGRDGAEQPSSRRGHRPGLNHLGWEMESEKDLVAALGRASATGAHISHSVNHQISHSAYVVDPDGNYHEFYADTIADWRTIFNLDHEDLVTEQWDWKKAGDAMGPCYPVNPEKRRVANAPLHPVRITHVRLVARDYKAMLEFMTRVAGLHAIASGDGIALLEGRVQGLALVLVSEKWGVPPGLHSLSFLLDESTNIEAANHALAGTIVEGKQAVVVKDPDGLLVEFYRRDRAPQLPSPRRGSRDWLFAD